MKTKEPGDEGPQERLNEGKKRKENDERKRESAKAQSVGAKMKSKGVQSGKENKEALWLEDLGMQRKSEREWKKGDGAAELGEVVGGRQSQPLRAILQGSGQLRKCKKKNPKKNRVVVVGSHLK